MTKTYLDLNTNQTYTKSVVSYSIPPDDNVRVTQMKCSVEILHMAKEPKGLLRTRRLDKFSYLDLETGEVRKYRINETREHNLKGLLKSKKMMRHYINNNFTGSLNEKFITLTYDPFIKPNIELKCVYDDFRKFLQKLKRRYGNVDYINVPELHLSGVWHCHALLRFNDFDKIFVDNDTIVFPAWGNGWTKTKSITSVNNLGAYFSSKLSFINNAYDVRLESYPSGMKLFRCSRGILKPETNIMQYHEALGIVRDSKLSYSQTVEVHNSTGNLLNSITLEEYKKL